VLPICKKSTIDIPPASRLMVLNESDEPKLVESSTDIRPEIRVIAPEESVAPARVKLRSDMELPRWRKSTTLIFINEPMFTCPKALTLEPRRA
jgi:hypothetical protein